MKKVIFLFITLVSFLYANKPELTVNILPQKYFVQKIVKDKYEINVMVKPGSSPHNYEPKPSQMKSLVASKVYFLAGDTSEKVWLEKFKQSAKNMHAFARALPLHLPASSISETFALHCIPGHLRGLRAVISSCASKTRMWSVPAKLLSM